MTWEITVKPGSYPSDPSTAEVTMTVPTRDTPIRCKMKTSVVVDGEDNDVGLTATYEIDEDTDGLRGRTYRDDQELIEDTIAANDLVDDADGLDAWLTDQYATAGEVKPDMGGTDKAAQVSALKGLAVTTGQPYLEVVAAWNKSPAAKKSN